ncbi:MAG: flavodoxin family protein [Actinobacteria bacterium]|nr:flavodoxin family protein [Actinomycetota bacterium]
MNALVVFAHPDPESYNRALADAVVRGLASAGHQVTLLDLYALDYPGALSPAEWAAYTTDQPIVDPLVAEHARLVKEAELLVFVYPTWWSSVPAILKAWFERTLVMGTAFSLDPRTQRVRPGLTHVRRVVGVTTYGSPWWYIKAVNDNGRRTIARTLRVACGRGTKVSWHALYALDGRTEQRRREFVTAVESSMAAIR